MKTSLSPLFEVTGAVAEMGLPCLQAGCARLFMPVRQVLKPLKACFGPSTEPLLQVRQLVSEVTAGSL